MAISGYLRRLREKIGSDLVLMPAATVVTFDDWGRVLLVNHVGGGGWGTPGGSLDPDESSAEAAVREVWEETGLLVEPLRVTGVYGGSDFHATYPNGDRIAVYSVMFECRVVVGEASPDGIEVAALGYFAPEMVRDLVPQRWQRRVFDALDGQPSTYYEPPTWRPSST